MTVIFLPSYVHFYDSAANVCPIIFWIRHSLSTRKIQVHYLSVVRRRRRPHPVALRRDRMAVAPFRRLHRISPQRRRWRQTTNTFGYAVRCAETTRRRFGRELAPAAANMSPRLAETARSPPQRAPRCPTVCRDSKAFRRIVLRPETWPILARNSNKIAY